MVRIASATGVPWATRTSTWRSLATISSGLCLFRDMDPSSLLRSHTSGRTTSKGEDQCRRRPRHRVPGPQLSGRAALVLPSGATLGLAHQTIWARPPKGVTPQTRESAVWAETVETIGRPPDGTAFVSVGDRGADIFAHLESVRDAGWDAVVRAVRDRRLVQG